MHFLWWPKHSLDCTYDSIRPWLLVSPRLHCSRLLPLHQGRQWLNPWSGRTLRTPRSASDSGSLTSVQPTTPCPRESSYSSCMVHGLKIYVYIYIYTHILITYRYVCVYLSFSIYISLSLYIYICIYIYIYTYTYHIGIGIIYMYIYIYIYIHTYTRTGGRGVHRRRPAVCQPVTLEYVGCP